MQKVNTLVSWIQESSKIVFFGGAGTSTESGIPDFRSAAGLYQSEQHSPYPPEVMLSHHFFIEHPEVFYDFYRSKMIHEHAKPNACHNVLADLEKRGKLKAIVTQNIDGLHQKAGSTKVLELHGSIHRNYCMGCSYYYGLEVIIGSEDIVPRCSSCGAVIKPDVVLYEESLDQQILYQSMDAISSADLLIIGGTSLTVQPAAHLISYFKGSRTVLLNIEPTIYDHQADLLITDPIGEVMEKMSQLI
ncbi:NAD-dependent protein deacylase [Paenibacillus crassostreae]|uniref:NAD-dependent protein deacetylase n=1 Tax=Paenibacillus crassostreae TaxID=1763538 RepID=A0A167CIF1_9BACL|nr:NAD-dependent protein deacylase [Paenibacillus crassostreae]AOZ91845.1 NAD-dependent protein deacylase [Paenibacillus crassostreae]OAB73232.1 NAD-dependent deacetylase [Paenibacillus crassostreae]